MARRINTALALVALGAAINVLVTLAIAQFSSNLPACVSTAREFAVRKVMKEPNPTPPIWPAFNERGWGVSYVGVHPQRTSASQEPDSYIRVMIQAGFPCRCASTSMEYKKFGAWSDPTSVLPLVTRRDHRGRLVPRVLPLKILWPQLAVNSLTYAAVLCATWCCIFELRRRRRTQRNLCPKCAYPIGSHPVCTECGASLPVVGE